LEERVRPGCSLAELVLKRHCRSRRYGNDDVLPIVICPQFATCTSTELRPANDPSIGPAIREILEHAQEEGGQLRYLRRAQFAHWRPTGICDWY
jgi:hypothetical protein